METPPSERCRVSQEKQRHLVVLTVCLPFIIQGTLCGTSRQGYCGKCWLSWQQDQSIETYFCVVRLTKGCEHGLLWVGQSS